MRLLPRFDLEEQDLAVAEDQNFVMANGAREPVRQAQSAIYVAVIASHAERTASEERLKLPHPVHGDWFRAEGSYFGPGADVLLGQADFFSRFQVLFDGGLGPPRVSVRMRPPRG